MKLMLIAIVTSVTMASIVGCSPGTSSDDEPSSKPTPVAFVGKVEPSFVGNWKTGDNSTELDLHQDGGLTIVSTTPGHPGPPSSKMGKWLVSDTKLLLQYGNSDGSQQTLSYTAKMAGKKLVLTTSVPKRDTVYNRI